MKTKQDFFMPHGIGKHKKEVNQMRKRGQTLFVSVLPLLLPLLALPFFRSSDVVYARHALFAKRHLTGFAFSLKAPMWMYVNNVGSDGGNREDATVTFRPNMPADGTYTLTVTYLCGSSDRSLELLHNGETAVIPCPGDDWSEVKTTSVQIPLHKGKNTLRFGNANWYAPNLAKIKISKGAEPVPTPNTPAELLKKIARGQIELDIMSNGTYGVAQNGRVLLKNAFGAVDAAGRRLYTYDYDQHEITRLDNDQVELTHTSEDLPELRQSFRFKDGCLLTDITVAGGSTNWISPLYTTDPESLKGGKSFLRTPYDNDDFVSFELHPLRSVGKSYEMTALLGEDESAVVVGSVTHDTWKTGIEWSGLPDRLLHFFVYGGAADKLTRDTVPHGIVTGEAVKSPTIFIGAYDQWQDGLNAYGEACGEIAPPLPWDGSSPMGWSSWGVIQDSLTREIANGTSDYYKEHFKPWVEDSGDALYINLDAWWNEALGRDVEGLRAFVEYCEANGQKAGIYHTPFACWNWILEDKTVTGSDGREYNMRESVLHDEKGNMLPTWDGAYPFDVTHPATIKMIEEDIQRFIDAGFSYLKLDFLSHGAMEGVHFDETVQTGKQAYNQAMKRIADQVDGRMFLNLSIAPIFPHQYANGRRLACDTFYSIDNTRYMLNSLTFGFWQSKIYACPDPDHIVIWGKEGKADENEARARVTSGAISASFLAGDAFTRFARSSEEQERVDLLLKNPDIMALARGRSVFQPAHIPETSGINLGASANIYALRDSDTTYYAVFNFGEEARAFALPDVPIGAQVKELWSGEVFEAGPSVEIEARDARVYAVTIH